MTGTRKVHKILKSKPTIEGAGAHLNRVFGNNEVALFANVIEGKGHFDKSSDVFIGNGTLALFSDGDTVTVTAKKEPVRFLLISGKPIGEPVAWYGPIVMNTEEELEVAFDEYRKETFIKQRT